MGAIVKSDTVARPQEPDDVGTDQYLTFYLGQELFALGIARIKEIIEYGRLTPVPMTPDFVRGVINLRGNVVPVIDLALRFARASSPVTRRSCIVIVEVDGQDGFNDIGIAVDSVSEVLEIGDGDIEQAPSFGTGVRSDFICGLGKIKDEFVVILDAGRVLSLEEMAALAGACQDGADTDTPQD